MLSKRHFLKTTALAVTLAGAMPLHAQEKLNVIASFSILGDVVSEIGGDAVTVTTLVGAGGDTHVFKPTPADARILSGADVLIVNGVSFEGWLDRLVEASGFTGPQVVATTGIELIAFEEDGHHDDHDDHDDHDGHDDHDDEHHDEEHDEHDHEEDHDDHHDDDHAEDKDHDDHDDHHDEEEHDEEHDDHAEHDDHHGHDHGEFDPHAWQDPSLVVTYAQNIAAGLAAADPANATAYFENLASYSAELEALDAEVTALFADLPEERRTVVTGHDAFGYFGKAYDLHFEAPQGMSTESEASAADVAALITQIREENIPAVFVETVTDQRLINQIAAETGAVVGGTLYSGALSGTDGPASTYIDMVRHNATTIATALK